MRQKLKLEACFACVLFCLAGCGSSNQAYNVKDPQQHEEEAELSDAPTIVVDNDEEPDTSDASTIVVVNDKEPDTYDAELSVQNNSREAIEAEVAHIYANYINENKQDFEEGFGAVGLIHIDDDEYPELVLSNGTAHASSVCFYSCDGNNVTELGWFGSFGSACYEYRAGIVYGYWSGQGCTYDGVGIVEGGKLINKYKVVITDLEMAGPSSSAEKGYKFAVVDDEYNETEISQEEYEKILYPYIIENRDYKIVANDYLLPLHDMNNIEESLLKSLEAERSYPEVPPSYQYSEYFNVRVTPMN